MFEHLTAAPPDAILGLTDAFRADPNPNKINLSVGVYKDAQGKTPILATVKEAERRLLASEIDKNYLAIEGHAGYGQHVQNLLFGKEHEIVTSRRAAAVQTPGGTAALRVAADFLKKLFPSAMMWVSKPTWPNHPGIFQAAGLSVGEYTYFDAATNTLALSAMLESLGQAKAGDVVLLHGGCHNPTGIDPTPEEWRKIAAAMSERKLLPLVDFAYQGFGTGIKEDAQGLLELAKVCPELLVCSSFSKNFGLYNERVGALTAVAQSGAAAVTVMSQLRTCVRSNYSNPPVHGAAVVATILGDAALSQQWEQEVAAMRDRINSMRRLFVDTLKAKGVKRDFSFIAKQRGMFSFSGLTAMQVDELRSKHGLYIVGNGRINVAGMTEQNMDALCTAIAAVE